MSKSKKKDNRKKGAETGTGEGAAKTAAGREKARTETSRSKERAAGDSRRCEDEFLFRHVYDHDDYGSCFRSGCDDCSSKRILLYSADSV